MKQSVLEGNFALNGQLPSIYDDAIVVIKKIMLKLLIFRELFSVEN